MERQRLTEEYLFEFYRKYIGEPDEKTDIYLGFGLFIAGIGLGVVGLVLFLWSMTLEAHTSQYYAWIEPSYALSMLALPVVMLGIIVLLPAKRSVFITGVAGVALAIVAVIGFLFAYPDDWHHYGADYTVPIVATYSVGLAAIAGSTGAALIAHYVSIAREVHTPIEERGSEDDVDDETVRRDIEEAMADVELSWGGVQKTEHRRLQFEEDDFSGAQLNTQAKTVRSSGVDEQVAGLKGLKGGERKTTTSTATVDEQTRKLQELRAQQRANDLSTSDSWFSSIVNRLRFSR